MRSILVLTSLVLSALAEPVQEARAFKQGFCNHHGPIISAFRREARATEYCSKYLGFGTKTSTRTLTVNPTGKHYTHWVTKTGNPAVTTATVTRIQVTTIRGTSTITVTSTNIVTGSLTDCTSEQTPVPIDKRQIHHGGIWGQPGGPPRRPTHFPPNWGRPSQSAACSCLPITSAVITKTKTKYGPTIADTVTSTRTLQRTSTITTAVISTRTVGTTITTTEIVTLTSSPIDPTPGGLRAWVFSSPYSDWRTDVPDPSYFKSATPFYTSTIDDLNFSVDADGLLRNLPPASVNATQIAVLAQGYFRAKHTGSYYIGSTGFSTDDWAFMWTGKKAFNDWNLENRDGEAFGHRLVPNEDMGVLLDNLDEGQLVPFTYLWINYLGAGQSNFFIDDAMELTLNFDNQGWFIKDCDPNKFTI